MLNVYRILCDKICELTAKSVPEVMIAEILANEILLFEKDKCGHALFLYDYCLLIVRSNRPQALYKFYSYLQAYIRLFEYLEIGVVEEWQE